LAAKVVDTLTLSLDGKFRGRGERVAMTQYDLLKIAMQTRQQVLAHYHGLPRELCLHELGEKRHGKLPGWRCMAVAERGNVRLGEGDWHTGPPPKNTCVDIVDVTID